MQFDGSPVRVVFWRGLRYSPAWVTENGLWLADQSMESGNDEGCVEHMQDIHTTYSHVRIVESSPARVVVHWRYAPVSGHDHNWPASARSEWAWWVDEYYTFYPDGTGVRKVRWRNPETGLRVPLAADPGDECPVSPRAAREGRAAKRRPHAARPRGRRAPPTPGRTTPASTRASAAT